MVRGSHTHHALPRRCQIPYVLTTSKGTILAFAEARKPTCSDYTWTDLVMKRSTDGGNTWSDLVVVCGGTIGTCGTMQAAWVTPCCWLQVYSNSTLENPIVIGNAAPVQDRTTGRIWFPFCRNNSDVRKVVGRWGVSRASVTSHRLSLLQVLLSYSDDDGLSWAPPVNISSSVVRPGWNWVGLGPPGAIQLQSGRLLIPAYHAPVHWLDGTFTHPHTIYRHARPRCLHRPRDALALTHATPP